jgi:hypothetical protein
MSIKIENDEWMDLLFSLENHHAVFYKLWQIGKPLFTEEIETAACQFDKSGNFVVFLFNPEFWNSLDQYNRLFVICHECLHLMLNHGVRIKDSKFSNRQACNQCLDVVVNHLLVESFNFDRNKLFDGENYCWADTVFPDTNVSTKETFEYYYQLFEKSYGDGSPIADTHTVDDHKAMQCDSFNPIDVVSQMPDFEKGTLSVLSKHLGQEKGKDWAIITGRPKLKQKWESVIKNWSIRRKKDITKELEQWARLNRRLSPMRSDLMLPSEMEVDDCLFEKSKIRVCFFLDSSGSCWHLKDRFFQAALSLDPKMFSVDLFCFDVAVHKVDQRELKVFGGGGTSFAIIESHLQDSGKNYPDGVFVITDGFGDKVLPKFPNRWNWFLTEDGRDSLLPKNSNVYQLSDFE